MKTIRLKQVTQTEEDGNLKIVYTLSIADKTYDLKYEFNTFGCKLGRITERLDPVVVIFLSFALRHGYNFESTVPMSEELWYQLTYHVIPQLYTCNKQCAHDIRIEAPLAKNGGGGWNLAWNWSILRHRFAVSHI